MAYRLWTKRASCDRLIMSVVWAFALRVYAGHGIGLNLLAQYANRPILVVGLQQFPYPG